MEGTALSTFLTNVGTVITQFTTWIGNVAETIVSNPIYFVPIGIFIAGAAIGLFSRLYKSARG